MFWVFVVSACSVDSRLSHELKGQSPKVREGKVTHRRVLRLGRVD